MLATLARSGIAIEVVTARLVEEGVQLFADAFDKLLGAVARKRAARLGDQLNSQTSMLAPELETAVAASLKSWRQDGKVRRLWAGDAQLWTSRDEANWLGWLRIAEDERDRTDLLLSLAEKIREQDFSHILLLGMGGSSLRARGVRKNLRASQGPAGAAGPRFDRPGADSNDRKSDRSRAYPLHRLEQVRHHARTEYPQAVFFRVRETGGRRQRGRIALHRHHGSRITNADHRRARPVPAHRLRGSEHRRALFGAIGFRPGAGRSHGTGYWPPPRPNAADGALMRGRRAAGGKSRRRAGHHSGFAGKIRARQGHHRGLAGNRRFRRMARTAVGGIDRQTGERPHPGRCRAARGAGRVWARPSVRLHPAGERGGCSIRIRP